MPVALSVVLCFIGYWCRDLNANMHICFVVHISIQIQLVSLWKLHLNLAKLETRQLQRQYIWELDKKLILSTDYEKIVQSSTAGCGKSWQNRGDKSLPFNSLFISGIYFFRCYSTVVWIWNPDDFSVHTNTTPISKSLKYVWEFKAKALWKPKNVWWSY